MTGNNTIMQQMSLWEEAHAKPSQSPDSGRLWTIHAASSCSNISELAQKLIRNGSSGKTCPEYCRLNADGPSSRSLKPWPNSGLMGGAAWRVLDAQFFGVAQRRERVFLVINTRDWRRAAPVLFERESLCWDYPSSREKRKSLAGQSANGVDGADAGDGGLLTSGESQARRVYSADGVAPTLPARADGSGQNQSAVMLDFHQQDGRFKVSNHPEVSNTLTSHMGTGGNNVPLVKAFKWNQGERSRSLAIGDVSPTLSTDHNPAIYEIAGNIIGRKPQNGSHGFGIADPDENGAYTMTAVDRHVVAEIERERVEARPKMMCRADSQANAATNSDLAPTLMAHAAKDAPILYPSI